MFERRQAHVLLPGSARYEHAHPLRLSKVLLLPTEVVHPEVPQNCRGTLGVHLRRLHSVVSRLVGAYNPGNDVSDGLCG